MKMCNHPNVLPCYCCFSDNAQLWVVMPFMDRGSAFHTLTQLKSSGTIKDGEGIPEDLIAIILREALQGLEYLHDNAHIHRCVEPGHASDVFLVLMLFGLTETSRPATFCLTQVDL